MKRFMTAVLGVAVLCGVAVWATAVYDGWAAYDEKAVSAFATACEACGTALRPDELRGLRIRRDG